VSLEEEAVRYSQDGYNCAESVLLTFLNSWSKYFRMGVTSAAATAFGGGMGRMGHTCGALSGGLIVIGLDIGRTDGNDDEGKKEAYSEARKLLQCFQERWGALTCRELTQCDLSTQDGFEKYRRQRIHETKCTEIIKETVKMVTTILQERKRDP
jgi:C_GCAxxG_C_C family probable redox protein